MAITASIPIEMVFTHYFENEYPTVWLATEVEIDPADYPGLTHAWFEAILESGYAGGETHPIQLVDEDAALYATLVATQNDFERVRIEFTLNAGKKKYYVKTSYSGVNWCGLAFREARIILDVADSNDILVEIPLISGDESAPGCNGIGGYTQEYEDLYAYATRNSKTSYSYGDGGSTTPVNFDANFVLFKKDESKFATIDHWEFEVTGGLLDVSVGSVALFNKTTDAMVAGSEITFQIADNPWIDLLYMNTSSCLPIRKKVNIANDAVNFTNGDDFEFRSKTADGTDWSTVILVYSAKIKVKVTNATKALVCWRTNSGFGSFYGSVSAYTAFDSEVRTLVELSKFPAGTPVYYEATAKETGGGGASMWLHEMGNADYGNPQAIGLPTVATAITGNQPPLVVGDWGGPNPDDTITAEALKYNEGTPDYTLSTDYVLMNISGAIATIEASNFSFLTPIPLDAIISEVRARCTVAIYPQDASMTAWAYDLARHTNAVTKADSIYPPASIIMHDEYFQFTADTTWDRASAIAATVRVRFNQPSNTTLTLYLLDLVNLVIGWHTDVAASKLDFSTSARERQRTADISASLTDGERYITHFYGYTGNTITSHAMAFLVFDVTGTEGGGSILPPPPVGYQECATPARIRIYEFQPSYITGADILSGYSFRCEPIASAQGFQYFDYLQIAFMAPADLTLLLTLDQVAQAAITIPLSVKYKKTFVRIPAKKFKMYELKLSSSSLFYLFNRACEIRVKGWGDQGEFKVVNPFASLRGTQL